MALILDKPATERLLCQHGIIPPATDPRYLKHGELEVGTTLTIKGYVSNERGRVVELRIGRLSATRACPLSKWLADSMVDEFRHNGLLTQETSIKNAISHLLQHCSALYEDSGIDRLTLDPVYVNIHGYRVISARLWRTQKVAVKKRLSPAAHDRKAVFAYRPTGRK